MNPTIKLAAGCLFLAGAATSLVPSAVADVYQGTWDDDAFVGTSDADQFYGRGGHDNLKGHGGPDVLRGGPGADWIWGGRGHDVVRAGSWEDSVFPGPGPDVVIGGTGGDEIWLFADNASDGIRCGRGLDFVILDQEADPGDTFVACENVFINRPGDDW
jgi:Ca2+-binding RTX toxin-like protein